MSTMQKGILYITRVLEVTPQTPDRLTSFPYFHTSNQVKSIIKVCFIEHLTKYDTVQARQWSCWPRKPRLTTQLSDVA